MRLGPFEHEWNRGKHRLLVVLEFRSILTQCFPVGRPARVVERREGFVDPDGPHCVAIDLAPGLQISLYLARSCPQVQYVRPTGLRLILKRIWCKSTVAYSTLATSCINPFSSLAKRVNDVLSWKRKKYRQSSEIAMKRAAAVFGSPSPLSAREGSCFDLVFFAAFGLAVRVALRFFLVLPAMAAAADGLSWSGMMKGEESVWVESE